MFICSVNGISGAGKSTRVYQFLKYLFVEKKYTYSYVRKKGKIIGFIVPEVRLFVYGKFYNNCGFERLQGLDSVISSIGKAVDITENMKEISKKYNIILEGASITDSFRYRPQFLSEFETVDNILYFSYVYDTREHYDERIINRSGKKAGDQMWNKNKAYIKGIEKSIKNQNDISVPFIMEKRNFDTPVYDLGVNLLQMLNMKNDINNYIDFCKENDYTKINKFENWNERNKIKVLKNVCNNRNKVSLF